MTNEEAIKVLKNTAWLAGENGGRVYEALDLAISALEKQAEIVHCKDCIHWKSIEVYPNVRVCEFAGYLVGENGYCVYGEVKE